LCGFLCSLTAHAGINWISKLWAMLGECAQEKTAQRPACEVVGGKKVDVGLITQVLK